MLVHLFVLLAVSVSSIAAPTPEISNATTWRYEVSAGRSLNPLSNQMQPHNNSISLIEMPPSSLDSSSLDVINASNGNRTDVFTLGKAPQSYSVLNLYRTAKGVFGLVSAAKVNTSSPSSPQPEVKTAVFFDEPAPFGTRLWESILPMPCDKFVFGRKYEANKDGMMYIGCDNSYILALSEETGAIKWASQLSTATMPPSSSSVTEKSQQQASKSTLNNTTQRKNKKINGEKDVSTEPRAAQITLLNGDNTLLVVVFDNYRVVTVDPTSGQQLSSLGTSNCYGVGNQNSVYDSSILLMCTAAQTYWELRKYVNIYSAASKGNLTLAWSFIANSIDSWPLPPRVLLAPSVVVCSYRNTQSTQVAVLLNFDTGAILASPVPLSSSSTDLLSVNWHTNELLVMSGNNNELVSYSAATGEPKWRYTGAMGTNNNQMTLIADHRSTLFFVVYNDHIDAVSGVPISATVTVDWFSNPLCPSPSTATEAIPVSVCTQSKTHSQSYVFATCVNGGQSASLVYFTDSTCSSSSEFLTLTLYQGLCTEVNQATGFQSAVFKGC